MGGRSPPPRAVGEREPAGMHRGRGSPCVKEEERVWGRGLVWEKKRERESVGQLSDRDSEVKP